MHRLPTTMSEISIVPSCRPNITIFFTLLAVGVSFGWLGVEDPAHWKAGVALYILGREYPYSSWICKPLARSSDCVSGELSTTHGTH